MSNTQRRLNIALAVDSGGMDEGIKAGLAKAREFADETKRIDADIAANQRRLAEMTRAAMADPADTGKRMVAQRAADQLNEILSKKSVAAGLAEMEAKALAEEQATKAALEGELAIKRQETAMQGMTRETRAAGAAIGDSANGLDKMAGTAMRLGTILAGARLAAGGMEIAASAIEGDWDKAADAFKRIPIIGRAGEAGGHLAYAIHNALAETGPEWRKTIDEANAATEKLGKLEADARREQADAAMSDEQKFQARWTAARIKVMDEKKKLLAGDVNGEAAAAAALLAVDNRFMDEQHARQLEDFKKDDEASKARRTAEAAAAESEEKSRRAEANAYYDEELKDNEKRWHAKEADEKARQDEANKYYDMELGFNEDRWNAKVRVEEKANKEREQTRLKFSEWSKGRLDAASPMRQYKEFEAQIQAAVSGGQMTYAQGNAQLAGEIKRLTGGSERQGGQFMDAEDYSRAIQSAVMGKPDVSEQILAELEKLNRLGVHLAA